MIHLYICDPKLYFLPMTVKEERAEFAVFNETGQLVQLVAQQERNIGFVHVQTTQKQSK